MNKKLISMFALAVVLTVSSCKKFLEITPQETFTSVIATSSLDGLTKTVTGAFNQLQSSNLYGGGIIANSELLADFVTTNPIADYSLNQLRTRQMDANNAEGGGLWADGYRAIYIANVVLQALPNFQSQNPSQCQLLKGECLFIRGAMHFELLRMFAQPSGFTQGDSHLGVCIQLTPGTVNQGQSVPRSTVAQCYAQIQTDLDSAAALLPATASGNVFVSQGAAQAFLMRTYFTKHNYAAAKAIADLIVNSGQYQVLGTTVGEIDSVSGVNASTPETIFQDISTSPLSVANGVLIGRFRYLPLSPPVYYMSQYFAPYYKADSAAGGYRWKTLFRAAPYGQGGPREYFCKKYDQPYMNITVLRYAEVLLTRAECLAQTGGSVTEIQGDLNQVRERAGLLPDNTTSDYPTLITEIRAQRDMELACEGDRLYEIKRRQTGFYSPESNTYYAWNSPQLIYAIPLQEVLENKNMVQNPGY